MSKFTEQQINELTVRVYYVRSFITASNILLNELRESEGSVERSKREFDLSALLDTAEEKLTSIATTLSP